MIDPQIADWLVRFAAGAGTLYEWRVTQSGRLRAYLRDISMCPITGQHTLETGQETGLGSACTVALRYGWTAEQAMQVIGAADRMLATHGSRAEIRARLLRICRVEEPAP